MKFKSFIDTDIEEFRKLNIGIVKDSEDELVRRIEEKFDLRNETVDLINDINRLIGKKKIGFTIEPDSIEEEIQKLTRKRSETVKLKLMESNSFLTRMKRELETRLNEGDRYFAEIRVLDQKTNEDIGINNTVKGRSEKAAFDNAKRSVKKDTDFVKGEKIKINVIDIEQGSIVLSKIVKV